jgi:hypothetical protein
MTPLPRVLLLLGILMTAGGVGGTGYFYRQMKIENLKHARTGDIPLRFDSAGVWNRAGFNVFREGPHHLVLSVANERRLPAREVRFQGAIEIEVDAADGTPAFRGTVLPAVAAIPAPGSGAMITLDSFVVGGVGEEPWSVRARVAAADTALAGLSAELSVLPPQLYDIGEYLARGIATLVAMGVTAVAGFILIVFSAHLQRRRTAASAR